MGSDLATSALSASFLFWASDSRGRAHGLDHALDRVLGHVQGELAGLDFGDIQYGIDEPQQVFAVGADPGECVERFLPRLIEAFLHELGITEDGGQWGRFVLAGDFELAALLGDLLKQACIFERDRRLVRKALHQGNDGRGEFARRAPLQNERTERSLGTEERNNESCAQTSLYCRIT